MADDPYQVLGVQRTASADEIRKAFRKLAKTLHPDQNPNDKSAEERFKKVSGAFDLLSDPEKRAKFDRGEIDADGRETMRGFGGGRGGSFGGEGPWGPFGGARGGAAEGPDLDDILGQMFGGGARGGGTGGARFSSRGSDVRAKVEIDLEEAILGATKRLAFSDGRTVDVIVPAGAGDGQVLRLKGQGAPGRNGPAGDALIELKIRLHPTYRVEGADLHMDLPVSLPDAVLGAKVQAATPDGPVNVTVPANSNSGARLRLKGRGASAGPGRARGDLFAHIVVALPEPADPDLITFAETMRRERPYQPRRPG